MNIDYPQTCWARLPFIYLVLTYSLLLTNFDTVGINTEKNRKRTEKDRKSHNHILFTEKEEK